MTWASVRELLREEFAREVEAGIGTWRPRRGHPRGPAFASQAALPLFPPEPK